MKKILLTSILLLPLLFACAPKKPEVFMTEVPAEPLISAVEQRRQSFSTLRAIGSVEARRKDRKRALDTVAVLVRGEERFKIEAYGPLGETVLALLWNGKELYLQMNGQVRALPPGSSGLERILGTDAEPAELAAILAGNVPWSPRDAVPRALCDRAGRCSLELRRDEKVLRVYPAPGAEGLFSLLELYSRGTLVYTVRYELFEERPGYALPRKITVENPGKRIALQVEYAEAETDTALSDAVFSIPGIEGDRGR